MLAPGKSEFESQTALELSSLIDRSYSRARILGANYENDLADPSSSQSADANRPQSMNSQQQANKRNDLNLVRTPTGPSGQSSGFAQRR